MREILFRSKRTDNGEWVEGYFCRKYFPELPHDRCVIQYKTEYTKEWRPDYMVAEVISETVGQFTGLLDKNGKKIFEGDYCRVTRHCILCYGSITFIKGSFWFDEFNTDSVLELSKLEINNFEIEVIGNIHDNPEFLKEGVEE